MSVASLCPKVVCALPGHVAQKGKRLSWAVSQDKFSPVLDKLVMHDVLRSFEFLKLP